MRARSVPGVLVPLVWLAVVYPVGRQEGDWPVWVVIGATVLLGFVVGRWWALFVPLVLILAGCAYVLLFTTTADYEEDSPSTIVAMVVILALPVTEAAVAAGVVARRGVRRLVR